MSNPVDKNGDVDGSYEATKENSEEVAYYLQFLSRYCLQQPQSYIRLAYSNTETLTITSTGIHVNVATKLPFFDFTHVARVIYVIEKVLGVDSVRKFQWDTTDSPPILSNVWCRVYPNTAQLGF